MSLIETLGINVVLLSFLMYIDFNYFNFNFNFISMYIDRHGISDDPRDPGSCKILESCVKF